MNNQTEAAVAAMAATMRKNALRMGYAAGSVGAHFGSGLSIIELTATLYGAVMNHDMGHPDRAERDRFILSKGHGSLGLYTALAEAGLLTKEELFTFEQNEGILPGQPQMNPLKGIEVSSGSLGHGLSIGIGSALAAQMDSRSYHVYVLMGDGECNEGTVWEAAASAAHFRLGNLTVIIDRNNLQSDGRCADVMPMDDMAAKWHSFGWQTDEVDGHAIGEIYDALTRPRVPGTPLALIARTVKGKGVSFMESNNEWHHNRLTKTQFEAAMAELDLVPEQA